jgi:shikimate dehydrogenase
MAVITGKTVVYGVIGDPIEHTLSPLIQNRAIGAMGIDAVYTAFRVAPERLEDAIRGMRAFGIGGLNVTVPHKTAIIAFLDDITGEAKAVGAVNTVMNRNGRLVGDNTDVHGFLMCVLGDGGIEQLPGRVCVLGAGGAARGVVFACAVRDEVKEVIIVNRTVSKAEAIAADLAGVVKARITAVPATDDTIAEEVAAAGLVVNTTSVGMHPNTGDSPVVRPEAFHAGQIACDIVYNPIETMFLRDAAARGAKPVGGLAMLAHQGARSLSLWTGREAPSGIMLDALKEAMETRG